MRIFEDDLDFKELYGDFKHDYFWVDIRDIREALKLGYEVVTEPEHADKIRTLNIEGLRILEKDESISDIMKS